MKVRHASVALFTSAMLWVPTAIAQAEDETEAETQDALFLIEEAYTQEKGEWQVGIIGEFANDLETTDEDESADLQSRAITMELEYGLTERLQIELGSAYVIELADDGDGRDTTRGFEDLEFGLSYALTKEHDAVPEISVGISGLAPTGDASDGFGRNAWGYELSARMSKQVADGLFVHVSAAHERIGDAVDDEAKVDEREWTFGGALAWQLTDRTTWLFEGTGSREKEVGAAETTLSRTAYVSTGFIVEPLEGLSVGLAGALGVTDDSFGNRILLKSQYEW